MALRYVYNFDTEKLDVVQDVSGFLKLDCSNDPLTGDLEILKVDPTLTLTDSGDSGSAVFTRADTNTQMDIKNSVYREAGFLSVYPPAQTGTYVKSTSKAFGFFEPYWATDPLASLIGATTILAGWVANSATNQRFHIDLGSSKIATRLYYENGHNTGTPFYDAKAFTIQGTNDATAFATLTYATDTNWTDIPAVDAITGLPQFTIHSSVNAPDPQYVTLTNTTAYRYYAIKIANCWSGTNIGIRRAVFQETQPAANVTTNVIRSLKTGVDGYIGQVILGDTTSLIRLNQTDRSFYFRNLLTEEANSATAVGFNFNTTNTLTTAGSKLFKISNNGVEVFAFYPTGQTGLNNPATLSGTLNVKNIVSSDGATLGTEILTASGWTSTGWTGDWATGWIHTAGNTTALSNSTSVTGSSRYLVTYTISGRTAGTVTISLGIKTKLDISTSGYFGCTPNSPNGLVVTPSSLFDGKIVISLKLITASSGASVRIESNGSNNATEMRQSANNSSFYIGTGGGQFNTNQATLNNLSFGATALNFVMSGDNNIAVGSDSMRYNEFGSSNTAIGNYSQTEGVGNRDVISIGDYSMNVAKTATNVVAIGKEAFRTGAMTADKDKMAIGNYAGKYSNSESGVFYLDMLDRTDTNLDKTGALFYGTFNATPASQTLRINAQLTQLDNFNHYFGTANDASIVYDADSLNIKSNLVTATDSLEFTGGTKGIKSFIGATQMTTLTATGLGVHTVTPGAGVDISEGSVALQIGADSGARTRTNATAKYGRFGVVHYTNNEEPVGLVWAKSDLLKNEIWFGGGTSNFNAANYIYFNTAVTTTTTTGTTRMTIESSGNVGIGTTSPISVTNQKHLTISNSGIVGVYWQNLGASANSRNWNFLVNGNNFEFQAVDDAISASSVALKFTRTAGSTTVTAVEIPSSRLVVSGTGDTTIAGKVGIGLTAPTAVLHLKAGTATASTAPLKFTSGTLLAVPESGVVEFLTDDYYGTITTGAARKKFVLDDGTDLTATRVPFATTNGRLTDSVNLSYSTANGLTALGGHIGSITTVTDTYQVLVTDATIICNKLTAFTVTLPTAVVGQIFHIKNINTGVVTLEGNSTDTIDGELNQIINQWDSIKVQCYVANKWVII